MQKSIKRIWRTLVCLSFSWLYILLKSMTPIFWFILLSSIFILYFHAVSIHLSILVISISYYIWSVTNIFPITSLDGTSETNNTSELIKMIYWYADGIENWLNACSSRIITWPFFLVKTSLVKLLMSILTLIWEQL